ncbi:MAG TPA: GIDE domain-containing protein [Miltoncostaeaceae bacterium]|nr:GIDE domain-containing protein [Miltoncostaeaceae bacterium]
MLIAAAICAVLAVLAFLGARHNRGRLRRFAEVPTYDAAQIGQVAADAPGMRVELKGRAGAGPGGPVTAPLTESPCVWYRTRTSVRTRRTSRDSEGRTRTTQSDQTLSDETSKTPFMLVDASGAVPLDPDGASIDQPREVADRFERGAPSVSVRIGPVTLGGDGDVIGYRYEEWVIREGDPLYVLGGAHGDAERPEVRKPRDGQYLISLRSEEELMESAGKWGTVFVLSAAALAVAALVLAVLGVVL